MVATWRRSLLAFLVAALGVVPQASANPGPEGDDVFSTTPMPAAPQPDDRLALGVGLLSGGIGSFVIGGALQRVWFFDPCLAGVPELTDCRKPAPVRAAGITGIVMMAAGVALVVPGAIITHRARRTIANREARINAVLGPRFVGLSGRF